MTRAQAEDQGGGGGPHLGLPRHVLPAGCRLQMHAVCQAMSCLTKVLRDPTLDSLSIFVELGVAQQIVGIC